MTILNVLSKDEIALFGRPPRFTPEERSYFFTLPAWAEKELTQFKTSINKVGFILQLGYFQATKRFYEKHLFPESDVQNVSIRIGLEETVKMNGYMQTTLLRHRKIILEKLGYHPFSEAYQQQLAIEADFLFSKQSKLKDVFESLLLFLDKKRVEIPTYNLLAHIITDAFRQYQKYMIERIGIETIRYYATITSKTNLLKQYFMTITMSSDRRPERSNRLLKVAND